MMAKAGLTGVRNGLRRMIPAEAVHTMSCTISPGQGWENEGQFLISLCWDPLREDLLPGALHWGKDVTVIVCSQLHPESPSQTTTGTFTERRCRQSHSKKGVLNFLPQVCKTSKRNRTFWALRFLPYHWTSAPLSHPTCTLAVSQVSQHSAARPAPVASSLFSWQFARGCGNQ